MKTLVPAVLAAVALTAPAAASAETTTLVAYSKSAAQPGVVHRVEVRSDGRAIVRVPGAETKRRRLKTTTMTRLRRLLAAARLHQPLAPALIQCADCYVYRVTHRGHRVKLSEVAVPAHVKPLLTELGRIARGGR